MRVVSGVTAGLPAGFYHRVTHYRHRVFVERLGWQLGGPDGTESDQFDRPDTVYLALEDEHGDISGCARLLPTTQPYLLSEIFPQLLNGLVPPRDPAIWELSRFAAKDLNCRASSPLAQFSSSSAAMLMREAMACAAEHGAKQLLTVTWLGIERLIRRLGISAHRAGPPMIIGGQAIFACWINL